MKPPGEPTYTINEAAALTGLHRNTIRMRVRLGQLQATVHTGKFGEEYRISRRALVESGLLSDEGPLGGAVAAEVLDAAELAEPELAAPRAAAGETPAAESRAEAPLAAALGELYQRHEQAMFRLGYVQAELERVKALAESAESLREEHRQRETELAREREERERREAEAERLRQELEAARTRLAELEAVRAALEELKEVAARQEAALNEMERRPWWKFW